MSNKIEEVNFKKAVEILNLSGYRLPDFEKMEIKDSGGKTVPTEGIVEYHPASAKINLNNLVHNVTYDSKSGIAYGLPLKLSEKGVIIWRGIPIQGTRQFDLSNSMQRKEHFLLLHSHLLEGGVNLKANMPMIKLHDPNAQAEAKIEIRVNARKAAEIIDTYGADEVSDFGMLFGIDPNNTPKVVRLMLYELADKTPNVIIDRHNSEDRQLWVIVEAGLRFGVLQDKIEGIVYGGMNLGANKSVAVMNLKANMELASTIEGVIKERRPKGKVTSLKLT